MRRLTPEQIQACFDYAARAERNERHSRIAHRIIATCIGLLVGAALIINY